MADSFESELERIVTRVSKELAREITVLILGRLGIEASGARRLGALGASVGKKENGGAGRGVVGRPKRSTADGKARTGGARRRRSTDELAKAVDKVGRIVGQSSGLALGDIERASGLPRAAVSSALKTLKEEGRVFMGGTRRFARYAASQSTADKASQEARSSART